MSDPYELYYYPGNASMAPHMLLEESGAAFKLTLIDRSNNGHKAPEYLKLNPAGRIPALVQGNLVLFESAAICLHIVDQNPDCDMVPELGSPERANFYKWLMFLTNTIQPEILTYHYTERHTTDPAGVPAMKAKAEERLNEWFDIVEAELAANGPYLLGDKFSAVDYYLTMVSRWGRGLNRPPRDLPNISKLQQLALNRPAAQRALATEGLEAPYV